MSPMAMRETELPLTYVRLADALGALCKWLDHHACVPVGFDIARRVGAGLTIRVAFEEDSMADAFEQTFSRSENR